MTTTNLLAICGSLRSGSVNAATMRAAIANAPDGVEFTTFDPRSVPFYDGDLEAAGLPAPITTLNDAVAASDGVVFFTPEYNGSYPALVKNLIDWLSRPPHAWADKGFTLVTTTPGARAGANIRGHFDSILGLDFFPIRHYPAHGIGDYGDKLADGELVDTDTIAKLTEFISAFAAHSTT